MTPIKIFAEISADGAKIILLADGPDEDVAYAAKLLETLTPLFSVSDPPGALTCPLTWPAVVQLSAVFQGSWQVGSNLAAWIERELLARAAPAGELITHIPPGLTPYPWQVSGALMIAAVGRMVIFDEMGTGKSVSAILGYRERAARGHIVCPIVVVCPNSVIDHWVEHFNVWAPNWSAIAWRGTADFRKRLIGTHDVYVVSYETAVRDAGNTNPRQSPLIALGAKTVIADEAHFCKNPETSRSRAVRRLGKRAQHFLGLSGTPITHNPKNLWPVLDAMAPGAWQSGERWTGRYCLTIPSEYGPAKVLGMNPYAEEEFWHCMLGQHRRVAKADVLKDLPPKVYSVRTVDLPEAYRKAYDQMESEMLAELPDGQELSVMGVLAQLTRLLQLASSAADVDVTTEIRKDEYGNEIEVKHQKVTLKNPSWKIDAMLEILEERGGPGGKEQTVVFAPSRQLIDLAGQAAAKAGYTVGYIKGGQSAKDRTKTIEDFQNGFIDVVCVVTQAGGIGITLTAARACIFLARPWSMVDALQAEDRLHRIGAEHESIEVYDIVAKNTIDSRVRAVLKERAGALSDLLKDDRIVRELLGGKNVKRSTGKREKELARA